MTLPAARARLNRACLLRESFGQLLGSRIERGVHAFFERRKQSLCLRRREPYRASVRTIEKHRDRSAAYCRPANKAGPGMGERLSRKIGVTQRDACGCSDGGCLKCKSIASLLRVIPAIDKGLFAGLFCHAVDRTHQRLGAKSAGQHRTIFFHQW